MIVRGNLECIWTSVVYSVRLTINDRRGFTSKQKPSSLFLARIEHGEFFWISSEVVDDEISQNIDADRALKAQMLARHATFRINLTGTEIARGTELEKLGFAAFDALHLACAESGGTDVFLTTDDKLLKRTIRFAEQLHVRVENPLKWLQNLEDK